VAKYGQIILWMITTSASSHNPTSAHPKFFPTSVFIHAKPRTDFPNQCSSIQNQRTVFPNWCTAGSHSGRAPFSSLYMLIQKWSQSHFRLLILSTTFWLTFIQNNTLQCGSTHRFRNKFYCLESHTEHRWEICSNTLIKP